MKAPTHLSSTLPKIVEDLFDLDASQLDQKLTRFRLKFIEISEQEITLLQRLEEFIKRTQ